MIHYKECEHSYAWIIAEEPTCTEAGVEYRCCSICGEIFDEQRSIPATGHAYGAWTVLKEPTCTEKGRKVKVCLNCGYEAYTTIAATGQHNYVNGVCADCKIALPS